MDEQLEKRQLDFDAIDRDMAFRRNADFVISAGTVTFHPTTQEVLVVLNKKYQEDIWQLPKGRRNIGEHVPHAAIRETYEETGYRVRLVPTRVPTRATRPRESQEPKAPGPLASDSTPVLASDPAGQNSVIDDLDTQPVGMVTYVDPLADSETEVQKMCFLYLATLEDPDAAPHKDTQDQGEGLEARWMRVVDARRALKFRAEREALLSADAQRTRAAAAGYRGSPAKKDQLNML